MGVEEDVGVTAPVVPDEVHRRRWWTLGVLCFSLLVIILDNTIVNVAIPALQRELGATTSELQWVIDAYVLVFAGLLLTAGALGDRFGRKGALSFGLAVMGGASAASALATSPDQLIATRALMGVGGAFIMPATLSILTNVFRDPKERGRAIAVWAGTSGMAGALGPVTGGFLLEHFWWGSVFLVNVPVVILALVLGWRLVPTSRDPAAPPVDVPGAMLSIAGLVTLVWAIIEAPGRGWTDTTILGAFAAAVVLLAAFGFWEWRTPNPMLSVSFFRNPRFSAASAAITLTFFVMFGMMFAFTQYLQFVLGYTALEAGVRMLPMAGVMMTVAPTSARIVERVGTKVVVGAGLSVVTASLLLASRLSVDGGYLPALATLMVMAAGMALTMAPATESIMGSLPPAKAGVGSAVNDTTRQVGGALGVAALGSVMSSIYGSRLGEALAATPAPREVVAVAKQSLGAAFAVAGRVGGPAGDALVRAAERAFVDGMHVAFLVGAAVAALAAGIALVFLPAGERLPAGGPLPVGEPADGSAGGPAGGGPVPVGGTAGAPAGRAATAARPTGTGAELPPDGVAVAPEGSA
jgi:EmrB/QacA subfamily drug resistance transporter